MHGIILGLHAAAAIAGHFTDIRTWKFKEAK